MTGDRAHAGEHTPTISREKRELIRCDIPPHPPLKKRREYRVVNRFKAVRSRSREHAMTTPFKLHQAVGHLHICSQTELCHGHMTHEDLVLFVRQQFHRLSNESQNNWLLEKLKVSATTLPHKQRLYFPLAQKQFCAKCFRMILGVSAGRWYKLRGMSKAHVVTYVSHHQRVVASDPTKTRYILEWFGVYSKERAQPMPHTSVQMLPPGTWSQILELLNADMESDIRQDPDGSLAPGTPPITLSFFTRVVHQHFPLVKLPERYDMFQKCSDCTHFKYQKMRTRDGDTLAGLQREQQWHLSKVMKERAKYWKHRRKARTNPGRYISLIIDGMDQHKTRLPRMVLKPKSMASLKAMKTHVTGVLLHGHNPRASVFVSTPSTKNDSNLTIECLMRTLMAAQDIHTCDVVYVQMDNCVRDNKNKYVFSFWAMLVQCNVFRKVMCI